LKKSKIRDQNEKVLKSGAELKFMSGKNE
jgi:hypothetical protein